MKTDSELEHDVREELKWEPRIREAEIGLAVSDGVVTLFGTVESYAQKTAAERAVRRVGGVHVVADALTVNLLGTFARSDTELAHQVANALAWDVEVPGDAVTARVEHGWVSLAGAVDWQYQRHAAERAVRNLTGVKGVINDVRLSTGATTADVSRRIAAALARYGVADAATIDVAVRDGRATLTGFVRTFAEREDAEDAAWAAPGVTVVDDQILVAA